MSLMIDRDRGAEWRQRAELIATTNVVFGSPNLADSPLRPDDVLDKKLRNNSVSGSYAPQMGRFYSEGSIDSGDDLYRIPSGLVVDDDDNLW